MGSQTSRNAKVAGPAIEIFDITQPKKSTKLSQEQVIATLEVQINYLLNGFSAKTIVLLF